jgi:hypothetical protein
MILGLPVRLSMSRLFNHRHLIKLPPLQARNVRHGLEHVALHTAGTHLELAAGSFTTEAWDLRLLLPGGRHCRPLVQGLVVYVDLSAVKGKPHPKNGMVLLLGWYLGLEDEGLVCGCLGELLQCHRLLLWEAVHLMVNIV